MFENILAMLFQLSLLSLAMAEETLMSNGHNHFQDNLWQYGSGGGVVGFIVLILDILVFIEVLKSSRPPSHKLLWCLIVFLFPIIGLILYWLLADRAAYATGPTYEILP